MRAGEKKISYSKTNERHSVIVSDCNFKLIATVTLSKINGISSLAGLWKKVVKLLSVSYYD